MFSQKLKSGYIFKITIIVFTVWMGTSGYANKNPDIIAYGGKASKCKTLFSAKVSFKEIFNNVQLDKTLVEAFKESTSWKRESDLIGSNISAGFRKAVQKFFQRLNSPKNRSLPGPTILIFGNEGRGVLPIEPIANRFASKRIDMNSYQYLRVNDADIKVIQKLINEYGSNDELVIENFIRVTINEKQVKVLEKSIPVIENLKNQIDNSAGYFIPELTLVKTHVDDQVLVTEIVQNVKKLKGDNLSKAYVFGEKSFFLKIYDKQDNVIREEEFIVPELYLVKNINSDKQRVILYEVLPSPDRYQVKENIEFKIKELKRENRNILGGIYRPKLKMPYLNLSGGDIGFWRRFIPRFTWSEKTIFSKFTYFFKNREVREVALKESMAQVMSLNDIAVQQAWRYEMLNVVKSKLEKWKEKNRHTFPSINEKMLLNLRDLLSDQTLKPTIMAEHVVISEKAFSEFMTFVSNAEEISKKIEGINKKHEGVIKSIEAYLSGPDKDNGFAEFYKYLRKINILKKMPGWEPLAGFTKKHSKAVLNVVIAGGFTNASIIIISILSSATADEIQRKECAESKTDEDYSKCYNDYWKERGGGILNLKLLEREFKIILGIDIDKEEFKEDIDKSLKKLYEEIADLTKRRALYLEEQKSITDSNSIVKEYLDQIKEKIKNEARQEEESVAERVIIVFLNIKKKAESILGIPIEIPKNDDASSWDLKRNEEEEFFEEFIY